MMMRNSAREPGRRATTTSPTTRSAAEAVSPEHWIWDGVHPLPQGHELIARTWLEEVSA